MLAPCVLADVSSNLQSECNTHRMSHIVRIVPDHRIQTMARSAMRRNGKRIDVGQEWCPCGYTVAPGRSRVYGRSLLAVAGLASLVSPPPPLELLLSSPPPAPPSLAPPDVPSTSGVCFYRSFLHYHHATTTANPVLATTASPVRLETTLDDLHSPSLPQQPFNRTPTHFQEFLCSFECLPQSHHSWTQTRTTRVASTAFHDTLTSSPPQRPLATC